MLSSTFTTTLNSITFRKSLILGLALFLIYLILAVESAYFKSADMCSQEILLR